MTEFLERVDISNAKIKLFKHEMDLTESYFLFKQAMKSVLL